jgi:hypothetical protein
VSRVIVIEFVTVDGVTDDPDGRAGTAHGGWAFRYGSDSVAGDKFRLGELMETGRCCWGAGRGSCSRASGPRGATNSRTG